MVAEALPRLAAPMAGRPDRGRRRACCAGGEPALFCCSAAARCRRGAGAGAPDCRGDRRAADGAGLERADGARPGRVPVDACPTSVDAAVQAMAGTAT